MAEISQDVLDLVANTATDATFGVWFLIGAAFVFFMQAGFAMVETGFTRAKNAGNIIMKNLMDFCIGTVMFSVLGFSLMMAEDTVMGIFGIPNMKLFTDFQNINWSSFVFNLVFCATAATIVSGAMAERTKFSAYCVYSAVISLVVYPIEACWIWNPSGWLVNMGFIDFAGSCAIHMVGGISAFVGACILGPRIGKYTKGADGKTVVHAFPGHSITLGALGCFILWFGWYGFNGAAATNITQLAQIFGTTTIAAAVSTCTTMIFTWLKNGKPDVSMTLNGSLAGLVAITAPCSNVDAYGAAAIGLVAGLLVVIAVETIDIKIKVDDPVGAIAVHGCNGMWGTLSVGLFNIYESGDGIITKGLFYGGGFHQLGVQALGVVSVASWTIVTMLIFFTVIKKTVGIRVTPEEEIDGLDIHEHGLVSAYADFMPMQLGAVSPELVESVEGSVPAKNVSEAIPVIETTKVVTTDVSPSGMSKVVILLKQNRFEALKEALTDIGVSGLTVTQVLGCGTQKGAGEYYRGVPMDVTLLPKVKVEVVVASVPVRSVIDVAKRVLYTGHIGDGKIFVYNVENVVKVRTGQEGAEALQDSAQR